MAEGVDQIRRYHAETPEMFTVAQLFGVTQMFELLLWRNMERQPQKPVQLDKTDEPTTYEEKVKTFFDRDRFLKVLRGVNYFPEQGRRTDQSCVASAPDPCCRKGD